MSFEYWQRQGFALSPSLPLSTLCSPSSVYNFVDNLLPEGEARLLLAQSLAVSEKQVFAQVCELGSDLSGAISFILANSNDIKPALFRPIYTAGQDRRGQVSCLRRLSILHFIYAKTSKNRIRKRFLPCNESW